MNQNNKSQDNDARGKILEVSYNLFIMQNPYLFIIDIKWFSRTDRWTEWVNGFNLRRLSTIYSYMYDSGC